MEVANTAAPSTSTTTPTPVQNADDRSVINSDFETFLKMLTAQARYQDPLNPLDSAEYASQMAQFSTVEQQVKTNEILENLVTQMGTSGLAQYSSWIGMEGRSLSPAYFDGENPITVSPEPAVGAEDVTLVVRDAENAEVQRIAIPVSTQDYVWNGLTEAGTPFPAGNYSFSLENRGGEDLSTVTPVAAYTGISEARGVDGNTILVLNSGEHVSPDQITALRTPQD